MRRLGLALLFAALPLGGAADTPEFTTLKGHGGPIMALDVSASGQVASASFDNAVGLWDGRMPTWLEHHRAAATAVHHSAVGLLSGSDDNDLLRWSDAGAERLYSHQTKITAIESHGEMIASASWDGTIGIWENGKVRFLKGHGSGVNDIAFTPDGKALYSAASDGEVLLWDIAAGTHRPILSNGFGINELALASDGSWLAYGAIDGVTRIADAQTGALLKDFTLERRPILSMVHHPQSQQLAVGDGHGFIMLIDTQDWRITRDFKAMQKGPVWALDFAPDGQSLWAGGIYDVIYHWPIALMDSYTPAGSAEPRSFLRAPESMPNGERQFMRKCSICHALEAGPSRKAGPTLHALFGRPAGAVEGYLYSDILANSDIIWNDESIDALFDIGPDHYIPGSKMPMQRITAPNDRRDLIDYLRQATSQKEN